MKRNGCRLIIHFLIGVLTLCLGPLLVNAQKIRLYNSEQGLPNSLINRVYQDGRGYIWVATENGLCYFDGVRFTTFRHDPQKNNSIISDLVKVIFTDHQGICWIGSSQGMQQFDYKSNAFREYQLSRPIAPGGFYISSMVETPDCRTILISVAGSKLFAIDAVEQTYNQELSDTLNHLLNTRYPGNLFVDSKGFLWAFSEQGQFFKIDLRNKKLEPIRWSSGSDTYLSDRAVSAMAEDPVTGNILIGTFKHGLFIYDQKEQIVRPVRDEGARGLKIRAIHSETKHGLGTSRNIWIGTEDFGLKKFNRETEQITQSGLNNSPVNLNNCKVHSIIEDNQGNLWIGIYHKGVLLIPRSTFGFEYVKVSESKDPVSENLASITSILRDRSGDLFVGTDGGGLFKISGSGESIRFTSKNTLLFNNSVMSLVSDSSGTLWISTYLGGINTFKPGEGFTAFSTIPELQKVNSMIFDATGNRIFFGTLGYGVCSYSIDDKKFQRFPNSVHSGWISILYPDKSGNLWVGRSDGFACYHLATGEPQYLDLVTRLEGARVSSFLEDRDGSMWIGTANGLLHYKMETEELSTYTKTDGLPSNLILTIKQDSNGILWISTGCGLSRFDREKKQFRNFYAYDGLQDNEFRIRAVHQDSDGKMFFGGINGITSFYPEVVDAYKQSMSKIYFTRLTVLNNPVQFDEQLGKKNILDQHISQARQIRLKKEQNVFSLEFAVLEYTNPQKVIYGYQLEGFDSDWRYTDSGQRSATYTNLPDGRYTFRVKAFFEGSSDSEDTVYNSISIRILPPWYKTWWAYLLDLALAMLTIRLGLDYLIKRRLRTKERIESERRELKLRMFTDLSHEIRTPLTLVMNPLKSLKETETDEHKKEIYNLMHRNILRILRLINQWMDIRKIDNHQLLMHFSETDLIFFVSDIMKAFEPLASARNIEFRLISNYETLPVWIDRSNFDKVLFNIFSNAFKFTPDYGYIHIRIDRVENQKGGASDLSDWIELQIENSGSSIAPQDLGLIFDRFYQGNDNQVSGSGIGLHLAKMMVQLHHGSIRAENVERGVVFIIRLPLGKRHLSDGEIALLAGEGELSRSVYSEEKHSGHSDFIELPLQDESEKDVKSSRSKQTLIFVDDDADLCKYIKMELSDKYHVEVCPDGKEAWKLVSTLSPAVVVTDLIMPELDGIALCRKIRQNPDTRHLPIVVLTSQTDEESERLCLEIGADHFLSKPFSIGLLKSTLAQTIKTREVLRNRYRSVIKAGYDEVSISSSDSRLIDKVIESIRKNIENPEFSVDDLSREVGLSRVHLNRKLKENINISPSNLIKSIRLKQAAYLLINNKVNISEVAYKVGFSTHSYFSSNFKDYFGMAPSEFILKYQESNDKTALNKLFEN